MSDTIEKQKPSRLTVVILAGGKGTRMNSPLPKVLHPVAGVPMIQRIISSCQSAGAAEIRVVIGHGSNLVKQVIEPLGVTTHIQQNQLGTADAVKSVDIDSLEGDVLVLNGDHPLISAEDIAYFLKEFREQKLDVAVVSATLKNPNEFGRIVRHKGDLKAIVEARDASVETLKIREVNTGIYLMKADSLQEYLPRIQNNNLKQEYYLTDLISLAIEDHCRVNVIKGTPRAALGVNNQQELAHATRVIFRRKVKALLEAGVLVIDPFTTYVEESVSVGNGSVLYPNVYLRGATKVGSYCVIESNCMLNDVQIADSVQVRANSYLESCKIATKATIGPFARIRPETEIGEEAHIGNFVELKKVKFAARAKAGHLTYLGDAEIGEDTNIGCGTITCNYAVDRNKYKTIIGKNVFVGSDSQFVAPVTIGDSAVIGSGSTITKDVPAKALAVARSKQFVKENYVKEEKEE